MKKVLEIIGCKSAKGMFGIEIEAEGDNMRIVDNEVWTTVDDGSLRGEFPNSRAEFVLRKPIDLKAVNPALEGLKDELKNAKFDFSLRTSVHVHVNVQQLTEAQLMNFIYSYLLLEELLVDFCGQSRKANRFCLRLQDAEGMLNSIQILYQEGLAPAKRYMNDDIRYASINLAAIPKYGSVEFRAMRGTLDLPILNTWVNTLHNLREFATKYPNPSAIYEFYGNTSYEEFIDAALGDMSKHYKVKGWEDAMARCFSLSIDLPYMFNMGGFKRRMEYDAAENPVMRMKPVRFDIAVPPEELIWDDRLN